MHNGSPTGAPPPAQLPSNNIHLARWPCRVHGPELLIQVVFGSVLKVFLRHFSQTRQSAFNVSNPMRNSNSGPVAWGGILSDRYL